MMLVSLFLNGGISSFKVSTKIIRKRYILLSLSVSQISIRVMRFNSWANHRNLKINNMRMKEDCYMLRISVSWHLYCAFSKPLWVIQKPSKQKYRNLRKRSVIWICAVLKRFLQEFKSNTKMQSWKKYSFNTSTKAPIMSLYSKYS